MNPSCLEIQSQNVKQLEAANFSFIDQLFDMESANVLF